MVPPPPQPPLEFDAINMKLPEKSEGPRFRKAWVGWVQYNSEQGHPLRELVARKQLEELAQRSINAAIRAIDMAISNRTKLLPNAKVSQPEFVPPTDYASVEADR